MSVAPVTINGKAYVIVERASYEALKYKNKGAILPAFPPKDKDGYYPAAEAIRVSIARDIISERLDAGLSQKELANLAGIRVETLCRIETGKHSPSVKSIERIEAALASHNAKLKPRKRSMTTK